MPFHVATNGKSVHGKFTAVEKYHEFTLVPRRPVIDRQLGREQMGIMLGGVVFK